MLEKLKEKVLKANLDMVKNGLVIYTWGNVSMIDREKNLVVIKPSGVEYSKMKSEDMCVVDMDGNVVEGKYRPSSDTMTHLEIYKSFKEIGGICHTHSENATSFAQAGKSILPYGTTHADYFYGEIPVTREMTDEEISGEYERNTGKVIVETLKGTDPIAVPAILVRNHGVFAFGTDASDSVYHATVCEKVASMAIKTLEINRSTEPVSKTLLDKHYHRKHGKNAYYGQEDKN